MIEKRIQSLKSEIEVKRSNIEKQDK